MEWGIEKQSREQKRIQLFCKEREKRTGLEREVGEVRECKEREKRTGLDGE